MTDITDKRSCPICTSTKTGQIEMASSPSAEDLTFGELKDLFVGFRSEQIFFSFMRCPGCDLLYSPQYFTNSGLSNLYSSMPDNSGGEAIHTVSKTQMSYMAFLSRHCSPEGRWLEIGGDIGLFAASFLEANGSSALDVVEPNLSVHEQLGRNLSGRGAILNNLGVVQSKNYEGVIAIHVFDHLLNPMEELSRLKEIMKTDAHLIIVVHNEKSLLRKLVGKRWPPFCLQHPQLYSPESLTSLLTRSGFALIEIRRSTNYFSTRHLATMACELFRLPKFVAKIVPNLVLPLKLGNMIAVAQVIGATAE